MKLRNHFILFIGCCLLLITNVSGSAQYISYHETQILKYGVSIGDSATYEVTKVNISERTTQLPGIIPLNEITFTILFNQGLQFSVIVTNITEPFLILTTLPIIKVYTQFDFNGNISKETILAGFVVPITNKIIYWEEIIKLNPDPSVTYTIEEPILTLRTSGTNVLTIINYNIHSGWVTLLNQQTFDEEGNFFSEIEIKMISSRKASEVTIPLINIKIPFSTILTVVGVLVVVPFAFAGGILLAKLLKRSKN